MKAIRLVNKTNGESWTLPLGGLERVSIVYDILFVNEDAIAMYESKERSLRWARLDVNGDVDKLHGSNEYTDVEFIS